MKLEQQTCPETNSTLSIKVIVDEKYVVSVDKTQASIWVDGFQFAQYLLADPKPNKKVLPFQEETKRYKPKETSKKIYVPPVQVYFNALADNFINFWRGLLK